MQDIWIYILCLRFINTNIRYIDVGADFIQKKFGIGKLKYKPYNVFTNRIIDACYRISKVTKLTVIPTFNLNMKSKSGVQKDKTVIFIISKEKLSKDMENKFVNKGKELADKRNSIFYDWKM